ncbi:hypothetical protein DEO72_LG5g2623 [Vigna unguiculata]|nr:hypothetical protein DEO72_LG5g2623 [Vigna unguiculata]
MTRDGGCKMCGCAAVADGDGGSRWREVRVVEMEKRGDDGARCLAVVENDGGYRGGSWWRLGFEENLSFCFGDKDDDVAVFHWTTY